MTISPTPAAEPPETVAGSGAAARAGALLTVDLGALTANYRALKRILAPGAHCGAVLKADAYGLGMAAVAPALAGAGCRRFFVALPEEGIRLRALVPKAEVHVLDGLLPGAEADYVAHRLVPVLNTLGEIERWSSWARKASQPLNAAIHIDTGMNRLGLNPSDLEHLGQDGARLTGIAVTCVMSHLACADDPDHEMNERQRLRFEEARTALPTASASLANSAGVLLGQDYHYDLVRPGVALYGASPDPTRPIGMHKVVRLQGRILQIRDVDAPETVGYGADHRVEGPTRVATLGIGYADGLARRLGGLMSGWIAGHEVPLIGRVSMDLITVDVTGVPDRLLHPGALVDLMGERTDVDDVARLSGTIGYEVLATLGKRIHRVYIDPANADAP